MRWHTHTLTYIHMYLHLCWFVLVCVHVSRSPFCVLQVYPRRRRRDQRKRWASATRTKQRHFSSLHVCICVCVSALALCAVFTLWNREISTEKRAHTNAANAGRRRWAERDTHSKYTHMHTAESTFTVAIIGCASSPSLIFAPYRVNCVINVD